MVSPVDPRGSPPAPPQAALVVLAEQRGALQALDVRTRGRDVAPRRGGGFTAADRARLVELALRVFAEAGMRAEAQCHRILSIAEAEAAAIVARAHEDRDRRASWLVADTVGTLGWDAGDDAFGAAFFDFPTDDTDPWGFMDDDLVGVGPALVRRILGRR